VRARCPTSSSSSSPPAAPPWRPGLGAIPVWFLGTRAAALTPFLLGLAAGVMGVASIAGLLIPAAEEGSALDLVAGLALGGAAAGGGAQPARP